MGEQMLTELIAEIDALEEKATPGPWLFERNEQEWDGDKTYAVRDGRPYSSVMQNARYYNTAPEHADAEFLTALRNAWPKLRAALRASPEADLTEYEAALIPEDPAPSAGRDVWREHAYALRYRLVMVLQDKSPPSPNPGQTHYEGCWRDPKHHACAVAEVERVTTVPEEVLKRANDVIYFMKDAPPSIQEQAHAWVLARFILAAAPRAGAAEDKGK